MTSSLPRDDRSKKMHSMTAMINRASEMKERTRVYLEEEETSVMKDFFFVKIIFLVFLYGILTFFCI